MLILKTLKDKENELTSKQMDYQMIPKYQLKPQGIFFLKGSLIFDFSVSSQEHISNVNFYKSISRSMIFRDLGIIYRNIHTKPTHFDNCQNVIQLMKKSDNIDLIGLALKLEGNDARQDTDRLIKENMMHIVMKNVQVRIKIAQLRLGFEDLRQQLILQIPKDKYILFKDIAYDYTDMMNKVTGEGMNEALTKLIGCDLESMQALSIRKGIVKFIEEASEWKITNFIMQQLRENNGIFEPNKFEVKLLTLDDIAIDAQVSISSFICRTADAFEGFFHQSYAKHTYDRKIIFFEFEVQDSQIRELNAIRQQQGLDEQANCSDYNQNNRQVSQQKQNEISEIICSSTSEKPFNSVGMDLECYSPFQQNKYEDLESRSTLQIVQTPNSIVGNLMNDIPYIVQSQDFIERFYSKEIQQQKKMEDNRLKEKQQKKQEFKQI